LDPLWWTPRGYIIAYVDSRGSFASGGDKHYYKEIDGLDVYDTIEELAKIDGSNGAVGMAGASALAMYQRAGAVHQPPSLKAIIPFDGMTDNLADFSSHGGIPENHFISLYPHIFAFGNYAGSKTQMPPRPNHAGLRSDSDYWKTVTPYGGQLDRIKALLYVICGY
jgi:predicted acyl esterase